MKHLISVIVPIYKVEKYLKQCIDSILNQTYKHIEIILVDDGSPDKCGKICDEYANKDNRIRVIHKSNGGLSDARNCGIKIARGDYIIFVDSDDYINEEMCEKLLFYAITYKVDIVSCNFSYVYNDQLKENNMSIKEKFFLDTGRNILKKYFFDYSVDLNVVWNKIYKKELFFMSEKIFFPKGKYYEDNFTVYKLYNKAKKVVLLNEVLYYYKKREDTITSKFTLKHLKDSLDYIKDYYIYSSNKDNDIKSIMQIVALKQYLSLYKIKNLDKKMFDLLENNRTFILEKSRNILKNQYKNFKLIKNFLLLKCNLWKYYIKIKNK